jgi:hypothetical protein
MHSPAAQRKAILKISLFTHTEQCIEYNPQESRKKWMIDMMVKAGKAKVNNARFYSYCNENGK